MSDDKRREAFEELMRIDAELLRDIGAEEDRELLKRERRRYRVWFYAPEGYYRKGWIPVAFGHDEYARRTLLLGFSFTGRIAIALWDCGDEECRKEAVRDILFYRSLED